MVARQEDQNPLRSLIGNGDGISPPPTGPRRAAARGRGRDGAARPRAVVSRLAVTPGPVRRVRRASARAALDNVQVPVALVRGWRTCSSIRPSRSTRTCTDGASTSRSRSVRGPTSRSPCAAWACSHGRRWTGSASTSPATERETTTGARVRDRSRGVARPAGVASRDARGSALPRARRAADRHTVRARCRRGHVHVRPVRSHADRRWALVVGRRRPSQSARSGAAQRRRDVHRAGAGHRPRGPRCAGGGTRARQRQPARRCLRPALRGRRQGPVLERERRAGPAGLERRHHGSCASSSTASRTASGPAPGSGCRLRAAPTRGSLAIPAPGSLRPSLGDSCRRTGQSPSATESRVCCSPSAAAR